MRLQLVSHHLCPYVQRAAIALVEKGVDFDRIDIDLSNKPDWFLAISPLGKTPVLCVDSETIFESSVILEYLEETQPNQLLPKDPIARAQHRSWIEFGSSILNDIAALYNAANAQEFEQKVQILSNKFIRLNSEVAGEFFAPDGFGLVDAVFGPVFRYFDVLDEIADFGIMAQAPNVVMWRASVAKRPSVVKAVSEHYRADLKDFLLRRKSHLSTVMRTL
ncbi:glutathione S-transferase family protein [Litoreibacter sp.]|nr:glutathione S-transferase family protein [Litoreibacter sp.]